MSRTRDRAPAPAILHILSSLDRRRPVPIGLLTLLIDNEAAWLGVADAPKPRTLGHALDRLAKAGSVEVDRPKGIVSLVASAAVDRPDRSIVAAMRMAALDWLQDVGELEAAALADWAPHLIRLARAKAFREIDDVALAVAVADLLDPAADAGAIADLLDHAAAAMERIVVAEPDDPEALAGLSIVSERRGDLCRALGDLEGARARYASAVDEARRAATLDPDDLGRELAVTTPLLRRADCARAAGDNAAAARDYETARRIREQVVRAHPDWPDAKALLAIALERLAHAARGDGDAARAAGHVDRAIGLMAPLVESDADRLDWQDTLASLEALAGALAGDPTSAAGHYRRALDLREGLLARAADHPDWRAARDALMATLSACRE